MKIDVGKIDSLRDINFGIVEARNLAYTKGDYEAANDILDRAVEESVQIGHGVLYGRANNDKVRYFTIQGDYENAKPAFDALLGREPDRLKSSIPHGQRAVAWINASRAERQLRSNKKTADKYIMDFAPGLVDEGTYEKALFFEELGRISADPYKALRNFSNALGIIEDISKKYENEGILPNMIDLGYDIHDLKREMGVILASVGVAGIDLSFFGLEDDSIRMLSVSEKIAEKQGDNILKYQVNESKGKLCLRGKEFDDASYYFAEAGKIADKINYPRGVAIANLYIGFCCHSTGSRRNGDEFLDRVDLTELSEDDLNEAKKRIVVGTVAKEHRKTRTLRRFIDKAYND